MSNETMLADKFPFVFLIGDDIVFIITKFGRVPDRLDDICSDYYDSVVLPFVVDEIVWLN